MIHVEVSVERLQHSIWEQYPELKLVSQFGKLFREDKSEKKKDSSLLLWSVLLYCFPYSPFYNHPEKLEECANFLKKTKFKEEDIVMYAPEMENVVLTEAERSFTLWTESLKERRRWLSEQKYTENIKRNQALDKMHADTAKMFKDYTTIVKELEITKQKRMNEKANAKPSSLTESGEM